MSLYQKAYKLARRNGYTKQVSKVLAKWELEAGEVMF